MSGFSDIFDFTNAKSALQEDQTSVTELLTPLEAERTALQEATDYAHLTASRISTLNTEIQMLTSRKTAVTETLAAITALEAADASAKDLIAWVYNNMQNVNKGDFILRVMHNLDAFLNDADISQIRTDSLSEACACGLLRIKISTLVVAVDHLRVGNLVSARL